MTLLLKQLFGFLKLLNSETGSHQIAWGISLGFVLGMTPVLSLQTFLVILILLFFRVQIGAALIAAFFFKFVAYLFDPFFHSIGSSVLTMDSLQPLFTTLYNMPIIPFTRFNNSIVMGSGVLAFLLTPVIFFLSLWAIKKYREKVYEKFKQTKFFKALKATALYNWYVKYDEFYG